MESELTPLEPRPRFRRSHLRPGVMLAGTLFAVTVLAAGSVDAAPAKQSAPAARTKTITMLNWFTSVPGGYGAGLKAVARDFERRNRGVDVRFQAAPFDTYLASETTMCRAGNLPDLALQLPALNFSPIFPCLRSFTRKSVGSIYKQLTGWTAVQKLNGTFFALPLGLQGFVMYAHKANFRKAGLNPNRPPRTWRQFLAACRALKRAGIDPIGISGADSNTPAWFWGGLQPQFLPRDRDIAAFIRGRIKLTDRRIARPLDYVVETYRRGYWSRNFQTKTFTDIQADFIRGRLGMVPGLIVDVVNLKVFDESRLGRNGYVAFPFPLVPGAATKKRISFISPAVAVGISRRARNPALALRFAKYMTSRRSQQLLLTRGGSFPNRADVSFAPTKSKVASQINRFLRREGGQIIALSYLKGPAFNTLLQKLTTSITSGNTRDFLEELQRQQEAG